MIEMIFENSKTTEKQSLTIETFFFQTFSFLFFWETKRDQQQSCSLFHNTFQRIRKRLEHVEMTNEKKKGRKNLLKQRISSPPRIFPRARFEKRRIHSTRNRFVQTLLLHPSWKVGERVVPWMRGEPFWERGDGTSLDEKPARKKMVPKGRRECGVKSGEGWSALNYESTGTTLGMGELSPE